jgi:hypothetical protein
MEAVNFENQAMLKMLQDLHLLLKNGRREKAHNIRLKIGLDIRYWVKLRNNGLIINIGKTCSKPIYEWDTIEPDLHMAIKILSNDGYPEIEIDHNFCNINKKAEKKINIPFDDFWDIYNKKVGDKSKCEKLWNKLKDEERTSIIKITPGYLTTFPEKQYQPYPETFINQRRWENEIIPANFKSITVNVPIEKSKALSDLSDQELWEELKKRGYIIENNQLIKKHS